MQLLKLITSEMYKYLITIFIFFTSIQQIYCQNLDSKEILILINKADLAKTNYKFKTASNYYSQVILNLHSTSKLYIPIILKHWEVNHIILQFEDDNKYFNLIVDNKLSTEKDILASYCLKAEGMLYEQDLEGAKKTLDAIHQNAQNLKFTKYYILLSTYYGLKSNMKEATDNAFIALQFAQNEQNIQDQIDIYTKLSRYYLHESLYDQCLKYTKKAVQLQNEYNEISNLGRNFEILSYYFSLDSTKLDSTVWYGEKALYYANITNDIHTEVFQLLNLANIYLAENSHLSRAYIEKLNKIKSEYQLPKTLLNNIEIYEGVYESNAKNYTRAIEIFLKLKDIYAAQGKSDEYLCYEYLSHCYMQLGQYKKAVEMEQKLRITKEKFESSHTRKQLLESELKFESILKDKIILQNKITILNKEIAEKKLTQLYNAKKVEYLSIQQQNILTEKKNENLNNQIIITNQSSKLALNEKEMTILRQKERLSAIILISIISGLGVSLVFFYLLRQKVKTLQNLENLMQKASQRILNAKKQLEVIDAKSGKNTAMSLNSEFDSIFKDFQSFESDIENIIVNTEKYKLKVHHEIKAPINRIQYLLNRLSSSENILNKDKETLESLHKSIESMKQNTDKILLISKINNAIIEKSSIDLHDQIANVKEEVEFQLSTSIDIEVLSNREISADPLLLNILWKNLISNSIKYAHPERKLKILIISYYGENNTSIEYKDNGIGIEPNDLMSFQNTRNTLYSENSHKIGISIIQSIIDKHSGQMYVEKVPEGGTIFKIDLPNE